MSGSSDPRISPAVAALVPVHKRRCQFAFAGKPHAPNASGITLQKPNQCSSPELKCLHTVCRGGPVAAAPCAPSMPRNGRSGFKSALIPGTLMIPYESAGRRKVGMLDTSRQHMSLSAALSMAIHRKMPSSADTVKIDWRSPATTSTKCVC